MELAFIWTTMVLLSLLFGGMGGTGSAVSAAALSGASRAVTLTLALAGPLCLWSGFGSLLRRGGLDRKLSRLLRPVLGGLFPSCRENPDGFAALSGNVTANLLGLGNAATPLGIRAIQTMADGSGTATDEMCRLVVMNTASIQLLPTTVASVRSSLGCSSPFDILPAVWVTSICSVAVGLLAAKGMAVLLHRRATQKKT